MRDLAEAIAQLTPDLLATLTQPRAAAPGANPDEPTLQAVLGRMSDTAISGFVAKHAPGFGASLERVVQAFQSLVVEGDRRERLVSMARASAAEDAASDAGFEQRWQGWRRRC